ncbi:MAG: hypothetical protein U0835_07745 [Isosphaeraceae bacterium]
MVDSDPNDRAFQVKNLSFPGGLPSAGWKTVAACWPNSTRPAARPSRGSATSTPIIKRAFDMLTGKAVTAAFDINAEPDVVRDRYGRHIVRPEPPCRASAGRGRDAL